MRDVKAVDWLPLDQAVERLSRGYERAFLANVGPLAMEAAAAVPAPAHEFENHEAFRTAQGRRSLMQKVRDWLRRAA